MRTGAIAIFALALAGPGCISTLFSRSAGYDSRPLTVQTVSFFNQRTPSRLAKKSWKGDWIFRRDRLDMIDEELRRTKPDILAIQETLAKRGSSAENDRLILKAGALADYEWREATVDEFADTQETQSQAVALGVTLAFKDAQAEREKAEQDAQDGPEGLEVLVPRGPAKTADRPTEAPAVQPGSPAVDPAPPAPTDPGAPQPFEAQRDSWVMGAGGFLQAVTIEHEGQSITLFNVQMPPQADASHLWYSFVQERIAERIARDKLCPKRVIVAGFMPADEVAPRYRSFVTALGLKDAARGFCQIDSRCYTATPTNDVFVATVGDESPTRVDRIFVHNSALVASSSRNFDDSDPSNRYARDFGLARLWPTQRFGWVASVRLARCTDDELGLY